MKLSKRLIGQELKRLIGSGEVDKISNWAYDLLISQHDQRVTELDDILNRISVMGAGPEFILTEREIYNLADKLIAEGDEEELSKSIVEIKEVAQPILNGWLMCPLCQESWESFSKYPMIRCPNCNSKLHNPRFKSQ